MCLGGLFSTWVYLIYSKQLAVVSLDGYSSREFSLFRGVWQGCPLLPVLFDIVTETLANAVWANQRISRVQIDLQAYKVMLYADDSVFLLQDQVKCFLALKAVLLQFAQVSWYRINENKAVFYEPIFFV